MAILQINLLPDIKAEYLKAQRTKRMFMVGSTLVSSVTIGLVVIMFLYVNVWQREHSNNLSEDLTRLTAEYEANEDLGRIVTIQLSRATA